MPGSGGRIDSPLINAAVVGVDHDVAGRPDKPKTTKRAGKKSAAKKTSANKAAAASPDPVPAPDQDTPADD